MKPWLLLLIVGCKAHDKPAPPPPPVTPPPAADAAAPGPEKANVDLVLACIAKPDVAKCYEDMAVLDTPLVRTGRLADFARYATLDHTAIPDATQEPLLVVAHDETVTIIGRLAGTQAAPLETWHGTIASQGKPVGVLYGRSISIGKTGRIAFDTQYYDLDTIAAQLGVTTTAKLAPVMPPIGKPPEIVLPTGDDAFTAAEAFFRAFEATNDASEWFADGFTFTDSDLPATLDKPTFIGFEKTLMAGVKPTFRGGLLRAAGNVACEEVHFELTQDGPLAGLLPAPLPDHAPLWTLPTLVCARFATHTRDKGTISTMFALHRDRPPAPTFVTTSKVTLKQGESGMLTAENAGGNVDLNSDFAKCRGDVASGFTGTATVAVKIATSGKFDPAPTVEGVPDKLAACVQAALASQELPHPDKPTDGTFTIAFQKIVPPKPLTNLADTFADRFHRPRAD
ncbi:MAG: hypothetical protein QM831_38805 [Kofleriaceae bacterium]